MNKTIVSILLVGCGFLVVSAQETPKDTQKELGKVIKMKPVAEQLTADGKEVLPHITLNIVPVAKPRMTQSDKWKKRPPVVKY